MKSWQETFGELKEQYVKRSSERLEKIVETLSALMHQPTDLQIVNQLSRQFHWLSGSGTMYGYAEVSVLGTEGEILCEEILRDNRVPSANDLDKLKEILGHLSSEFARTRPSPDTGNNLSFPQASLHEGKQDILLIDDDQEDLEGMVKQIEEHGMQARYARSIFGALTEIKKSMPDAVIIQIPVSDGDAYELVEKLRNMDRGETLAIIIVSKQTGFLDKVRSIHSGADAHYEKPFDVKAMFRRIRYLLDKRRMEPPKILSVEDDPDQAAFIRAFLESAGYQVKTCTDPRQFESFLSAFQPDLVLLDVMLPGMTGYELARFLRQNERFATLPIIFLTTQGQLEARIEAAKSGVDEHLVKPVAPALLLSCVSARLERARFLRTLLHKDGLTNLLNYSSFMEQAQTVIAQQKRHSGFVALIVVDVDQFQSINEKYGFAGGDKLLISLSLLLRKKLRQSDIIGRVGGDEMAVIAEGLDQTEAVALATRLIKDFSEISHATASYIGFYATLSAGVAMLDANNMDLESWIHRAYEALALAKQSGRNCATSTHADEYIRL